MAASLRTPLRKRPHLDAGHLTFAQAAFSAWRAHTRPPHTHTLSLPGQLLVNLQGTHFTITHMWSYSVSLYCSLATSL